MTVILDDEEIISEIKKFNKADTILLEIWDYENYVAKIVITLQIGENPKSFDDYKSFAINEFLVEKQTPLDIKNEGYRIKKILKKNFKEMKIKSNLHYK